MELQEGFMETAGRLYGTAGRLYGTAGRLYGIAGRLLMRKRYEPRVIAAKRE